jgi:hypothetical protein
LVKANLDVFFSLRSQKGGRAGSFFGQSSKNEPHSPFYTSEASTTYLVWVINFHCLPICIVRRVVGIEQITAFGIDVLLHAPFVPCYLDVLRVYLGENKADIKYY